MTAWGRFCISLMLALCATSLPAREKRVEFDILKAANIRLEGVSYFRCFGKPAQADVVAHACYKVAAKKVVRTVAVLETDFGHPPMVTHGQNWHGHGEGQFKVTFKMLSDFKGLGDPKRLQATIAFTAPAQKRSFTGGGSGLPNVVELGVLDGFIYVQLALR